MAKARTDVKNELAEMKTMYDAEIAEIERNIKGNALALKKAKNRAKIYADLMASDRLSTNC